MDYFSRSHSRRDFFRYLASGSVSVSALSVFKEEIFRLSEDGAYQDLLQATPYLTEGPFYPNKLPLDKDNDLVLISDSTTVATGDITHLSGKILDINGKPIKNATIEIWQVDGNGVYLHTGSQGGEKRDKHFQGFGKFETGSDGAYKFRTIKPVPYPGRAPHIHYKIKKGDRELLTSQIHIAGHNLNARDSVLRSAGNAEKQKLVIADFKKMKKPTNEYQTNFDVIIGLTPNDPHHH